MPLSSAAAAQQPQAANGVAAERPAGRFVEAKRTRPTSRPPVTSFRTGRARRSDAGATRRRSRAGLAPARPAGRFAKAKRTRPTSRPPVTPPFPGEGRGPARKEELDPGLRREASAYPQAPASRRASGQATLEQRSGCEAIVSSEWSRRSARPAGRFVEAKRTRPTSRPPVCAANPRAIVDAAGSGMAYRVQTSNASGRLVWVSWASRNRNAVDGPNGPPAAELGPSLRRFKQAPPDSQNAKSPLNGVCRSGLPYSVRDSNPRYRFRYCPFSGDWFRPLTQRSRG